MAAGLIQLPELLQIIPAAAEELAPLLLIQIIVRLQVFMNTLQAALLIQAPGMIARIMKAIIAPVALTTDRNGVVRALPAIAMMPLLLIRIQAAAKAVNVLLEIIV